MQDGDSKCSVVPVPTILAFSTTYSIPNSKLQMPKAHLRTLDSHSLADLF